MKIALLGTVLILGLVSCENEELENTESLTINESIDKYSDSVELLVQRGRGYLETFEFKLAMSDAAKAFRLDSNKVVVKRFYADLLNNRPNRTIGDTYVAQRHYQDLAYVHIVIAQLNLKSSWD